MMVKTLVSVDKDKLSLKQLAARIMRALVRKEHVNIRMNSHTSHGTTIAVLHLRNLPHSSLLQASLAGLVANSHR